jgi:hypothetical protein
LTHSLVPVLYHDLERTRNVWGPYILSVAERQRCFLEQRLAEVYSGEIGLLLIVKTEEKKIRGLVGYKLVQEGTNKVGKIVIVTGEGAREWKEALHGQLKRFFEGAGCTGIEADVRPGWARDMKTWGYKLTHMCYRLDFKNAQSKHHN